MRCSVTRFERVRENIIKLHLKNLTRSLIRL